MVLRQLRQGWFELSHRIGVQVLGFLYQGPHRGFVQLGASSLARTRRAGLHLLFAPAGVMDSVAGDYLGNFADTGRQMSSRRTWTPCWRYSISAIRLRHLSADPVDRRAVKNEQGPSGQHLSVSVVLMDRSEHAVIRLAEVSVHRAEVFLR